MSTTFSTSAFAELDKFKTPNLDGLNPGWVYEDADEELKHIAKFIASKTSHNSDIDPTRIKFFYTSKVKKDGGRFILGALSVRDEMERMIHNDFDYRLCVFYPVWKNLDSKNKVIQLDKILCGVLLAPGKDAADVIVKKNPTDSREYTENMAHFGAEEVLKSSEVVDKATQQILEEEAEQKKLAKDAQKQAREVKKNKNHE